MTDVPKVALLIETARGFGRGLLSGIAKYSRLNGPWNFHITPSDLDRQAPRLEGWGCTGIIARITDDRMARVVVKAKVPTIVLGVPTESLAKRHRLARFSEIRVEQESVARLAADHLLERRFVHFAYVGSENHFWSERREAAFRNHLAQRGFEPHVYIKPKRPRDRVWEREQAFVATWIHQLPKPIGVFVCDDHRGRQVLDACRTAHSHVPQEVAVVGVDDDRIFCDLAFPPLSSVALNTENAGYRAAALLDRMMKGQNQTPRKISVEALHVVARRSTENVAVEDADVAGAMQFIRREHGSDISVERVAAEVAVSRRYLERRFRTTIGRTILEEIQSARLEHAKRLLVETTHPIAKIAELSGFNSMGYFSQFFERRTGKTPRQYRVGLTS